jgi:hypothetical protein
MRLSHFVLVLSVAACAVPGASVTTSALVAADAATSLAAGERITVAQSTQQAQAGMDPLISMTLRHADGRALAFQQANHANTDLAAQAPGGPLAQIMGLFGEESPTLWNAVAARHNGAPFICGAEGPVAIGMHEGADGAVNIVGLKQAIQFETRPDGQLEAVPYSPDQVCARLRFRRG